MSWHRVCRLHELQPERAVAALIEGRQVALVRLLDDRVYAVGHHDPFSGANVMARGIVGSATVAGDTVPTLISPMYKQAFDLTTGRCLTQPEVALERWDVRVVEDWVEVA
ncbi:MAG: nitrite reductase small subunit NirD [Micropruina sp.]|nr:nitrite reductase small subunit NirD [Micropruina sp.]